MTDAAAGVTPVGGGGGDRARRRRLVGGVATLAILVVAGAWWFGGETSPLEPGRVDLDRVIPAGLARFDENLGPATAPDRVIDRGALAIESVEAGNQATTIVFMDTASVSIDGSRRAWRRATATQRRGRPGPARIEPHEEVVDDPAAAAAATVVTAAAAPPGTFNSRLTFYVDRAMRHLINGDVIASRGELDLQSIDFDRFAVPPTVEVRFAIDGGGEVSRIMLADGRMREDR